MPAGRPAEQDKASVICDGDLYVFGGVSVEVWPNPLPLDHPFTRIPDNSKMKEIVSSESKG